MSAPGDDLESRIARRAKAAAAAALLETGAGAFNRVAELAALRTNLAELEELVRRALDVLERLGLVDPLNLYPRNDAEAARWHAGGAYLHERRPGGRLEADALFAVRVMSAVADLLEFRLEELERRILP